MWFVWVDGVGGDQFVGGIDYGDFVFGMDVWVQVKYGFWVCWGGQQQIFEVVVEYCDGVGFGFFVCLVEQVQQQVYVQFGVLGQLVGVKQLVVIWVFGIVDVGVVCYMFFGVLVVGFGIIVWVQFQEQNFFVVCVEQCQQVV